MLSKLQKKKRLYSFLDFSKALDSVWQVGLWKKLSESNINEKYFRINFNIYKEIQKNQGFFENLKNMPISE